MGGEGSGNQGRKKFGNKFYEMQGGYRTKLSADNAAKQMENIGIKTKVVKQIYWSPWPPHDDINGYVVWYIPSYHRPSRSKKRREDGRPRF